MNTLGLNLLGLLLLVTSAAAAVTVAFAWAFLAAVEWGASMLHSSAESERPSRSLVWAANHTDTRAILEVGPIHARG